MPSDPCEALLAEFEREGWVSEPFQRMLQVVRVDPANATNLLRLAISRGGESQTFLHAALSFVPETDLSEISRCSVAAFAANRENNVAASMVARVSLQAVSCLRPFLSQLCELMPNARTYYARWPWRGAEEDEVNRLIEYQKSSSSGAGRSDAFLHVLETRVPEYIERALRLSGAARLRLDLLEVGFDHGYRRLFAEATYHLKFDAELLPYQSGPVWLSPQNHPTWIEGDAALTARFGGVADGVCACCGGQLHNLLELDEVPEGIPVSGGRLQLATCLSCLGWSVETLFFEHEPDGRPRPMGTLERMTPEFPAEPLVESRVGLVRTPPRWQWQDWALSNSRENLNRLGGHPTWIQSADYPQCRRCDSHMTALLQLDSELPSEGGGAWLWGSGGICYVFWCDQCRVSATRWQCT